MWAAAWGFFAATAVSCFTAYISMNDPFWREVLRDLSLVSAAVAIIILCWPLGKGLLGLGKTSKKVVPTISNSRNVNQRGGNNAAFTGDNSPVTLTIHNNNPTRPTSGVLFSAKTGMSPATIQLGPHGPTFGSIGADYLFASEQGQQFLPYLRGADLTVAKIGGRLQVSTEIRDKSGDLVAELCRNEWQIGPTVFDRNYSDDALEVRARTGRVVLQVRIQQDRVQILGEWWDTSGHGIRIAGTGIEVAIRILSREINPTDPIIEPIFKYPSDRHFGELIA